MTATTSRANYIQAQAEMGEGAWRRDVFAIYVKQAKKHPLFREGELEALYRRAQKYPAFRSEAIEAAIHGNLRLVIKWAIRFLWRGTRAGLTLNDLIQDGNIGLMVAAEKFDPDRGANFGTYATQWICQGIHRGIANFDAARGGREPVHIHELVWRVNRIRSQTENELGREPTPYEVFEAAQRIARQEQKEPLTLKQVGKALRLLTTSSTLSIDENPSDKKKNGAEFTKTSLYDVLPERRPRADQVLEAKQHLAVFASVVGIAENVVSGFKPRTADIVSFRLGLFGKPTLTLEEIGERYKLTRQRIQQISDGGMKVLERELGYTDDQLRHIIEICDNLEQFLASAE